MPVPVRPMWVTPPMLSRMMYRIHSTLHTEASEGGVAARWPLATPRAGSIPGLKRRLVLNLRKRGHGSVADLVAPCTGAPFAKVRRRKAARGADLNIARGSAGR
jgi:hypothetical protein